MVREWEIAQGEWAAHGGLSYPSQAGKVVIVACKESSALLVSYHQGLLEETKRELLQGHLTNCKRCAELLEAIRKVEPGVGRLQLLNAATGAWWRTPGLPY